MSSGNRDEFLCNMEWREPQSPDKVWVRLPNWNEYKCCTAVPYASTNEAAMVFETLASLSIESDSIASPLCIRGHIIAFEMCSHLTRSILITEVFPVGKTYSTVSRIISAMMDMHDAGVCGLPPQVSDFVRTEDESSSCKLYFGSVTKENCSWDKWVATVAEDYQRIEAFVRELMEIPGDGAKSMELKKSDDLLDHFFIVLGQYYQKSFKEKESYRVFVLGHPLLKSYDKVVRFLKFLGWSLSQKTSDCDAIDKAHSLIPPKGWRTEVELADDDRYRKCLYFHDYRYHGVHFVKYCSDMMHYPHDKPNQYNLHAPDFDWNLMIRRFEEFYPSYLGLLWVALGESGMCLDRL